MGTITGICGSFSSNRVDEIDETLQRMLAAAGARDGRTESGDGAGLAAFGASSAIVLTERDGLVLALTGRPRLRVAHGWATDPAAVARALAQQGRRALAELCGDFALAAWDRKRSRGLLAVDRTGVRSIVYAEVDGGLVFASTLDVLSGHPRVRGELSNQAIFDYLHFHVCPGPQTIYCGSKRIPAGYCIEFGPEVDPTPRPYWSMRFTEDAQPDAGVLRADFVSALQEAVVLASNGAACGAFLSGGTDSSTVSGMLGRARGERAKVFSIGFEAAGYDEMHFARIAARHFDCEHHERYVTPADVVTAAPRIAARYDQPFGNASAIPAFYCAELARDNGVERLLAGDGGDELFGGNERYARQHLLSFYHRIPQPLRGSMIEPLLSLSSAGRLPGVRKMRSYVEQARMPMPARYESHNLLSHLGPERVLCADFLAAIDPGHPQALLREAHRPYADCSLINQMLGVDLRFTLADNDLPKVTRTCEMAGVEVAFPLLDEKVVEFSARLPARMKLRGTRLRWFFKEALRDFLPPEVIAKRKHGFGLPVGAWLGEHRPLLSLAKDAIDVLRPYRIVRPDFVDELCRRLLPAHPAYYGTMIWVLMMLGLWLDSRKP